MEIDWYMLLLIMVFVLPYVIVTCWAEDKREERLLDAIRGKGR